MNSSLPSSSVPLPPRRHAALTWWSVAGVAVLFLNVVAGTVLVGVVVHYKTTESVVPQPVVATATPVARSSSSPIVIPAAPFSHRNSSSPTSHASTTTTTSPVPSAGTAPDPSSPVTGLAPGGSSASSQPTGSTSTSSTSGIEAGQNYESSNWAGYVAAGSSYTSVSGSWTVPSPTPTSGRTYSADAAWIGIGGVTSDDLIQTGTTDIVEPNGTVDVTAFYELLPDDADYMTSLTVSPGDAISASITETSTDMWTISLTDTTTGKNFSTSVGYESSLSTAEWIEEDPSLSTGGTFPLDDFGVVTFTGGSATAGGASTPLSRLSTATLTMTYSDGGIAAEPSALSRNGFSVRYGG